MARALSICIEPGCFELAEGSRCDDHARTSSRNHHGVSRHERGHGSAYDRRRVLLLGKPCHWCGDPADTADYLIPQSEGGTLEDLVPACGHCNYARGAAMTGGASQNLSGMPPSRYRTRPDFDERQVQTSGPSPRRWFA